MSTIKTLFLGKEYPIPADVINYVDLVDFTNEIRDNLVSSFNKQIALNIVTIENDDFMLAEINAQVSKFIHRLLENDIYDKTVNDYLQNNKGYDLFFETKKKILRQLISIQKEKNATYRAGVQNALNKKEASVTGLDFGIISSSFVNHMIYAYMDASKQTKQEQEALKVYNRDIAELDKVAEEYDRREASYITNSAIPAMSTVFTYFSYELLDRYISDLIRVGKFDKAALDFINLERSNDLLKNLELSSNRKAIIESAFVACPFNMAVYMQAMKYDFLDYDSFQAAKSFKQGDKILSFLKEAMGTADYPNFVQPNYHSVTLLSRYTNKSIEDVLYQHTAPYADAVIREYTKIINTLSSLDHCLGILKKSSEDEILSGAGISKKLANSLVKRIVSSVTWTSLIDQCGHTDLFDRLLKLLPDGESISNKSEYDAFLTKKLFVALENARKELEQKITVKRAQVEAERQEIEKQKQKKRIKTTAICSILVVLIIIVISLPSYMEKRNTVMKEDYIEAQIQNIVLPLEEEIEEKINDDVIIDYYFSLENGWSDEEWYDWSFCIRLNILEDYRKSSNTDDQILLEIMDNCKILNEMYEAIYDDLDFEIEYEGLRIVIDYQGGNMGALKIGDLSSNETFYYEEYSGNRYLHSVNTEFVIDAKLQIEKETASTGTIKEYDENLTWYNVDFASSFLGKELNADGSISMGPRDYEVLSNDMYLFDIPGRFSHGMSSADADPVIVDILDWVTTETVDDFNKIINPLIGRYGDDYRVQHYNDAAGDAYMWKDVEIYEYVICWQNADGTVDIRWTYPVLKDATRIK